jgi:hypothetical protein
LSLGCDSFSWRIDLGSTARNSRNKLPLSLFLHDDDVQSSPSAPAI